MPRRYSLQIAIDVIDESQALKIAGIVGDACRNRLVECDRLIVEAGTPLIKLFGMAILPKLKLASPSTLLVADLKIADVGKLEAGLAYSFQADRVSVLALAPRSTLRSVLEAGIEYGKGVIVDFIGVSDLMTRAEAVAGLVREVAFPEEDLVFEFHRGIDEERGRPAEEFFREVVHVAEYLRKTLPRSKIAVAGGLTPQLKQEIKALLDADIYVVGRYITSSPTVERILEFFND